MGRQSAQVAPFTGAWIEITTGTATARSCQVAPFTGAWIEIKSTGPRFLTVSSLPSRERGLKSPDSDVTYDMLDVAPFTGAWIEITSHYARGYHVDCRSLHGSVD